MTDADLAARYGRTPTVLRRNRLVAIIGAALVALVFVLWVVWAGLFAAPAEIEVRDTRQVIVSDFEVALSFELTVPTGTASSCALQAHDESFSIVGWRVIDILPSEQRTRSFTETVRTSGPAVSGLIYRCWLP